MQFETEISSEKLPVTKVASPSPIMLNLLKAMFFAPFSEIITIPVVVPSVEM